MLVFLKKRENNLVTLYFNIINEKKGEDAIEQENDAFSFSYYFSYKMIKEVTNFFNLCHKKRVSLFYF